MEVNCSQNRENIKYLKNFSYFQKLFEGVDKQMQKEIRGLTSEQVAQRVAQGKVNVTSDIKTKSIKRIFYDNICTMFNLINVVLFVSLLLVGSYRNLLFIGVVVFNTVIGIIQEIRSKKSVDRLTILSESKVSVLRDGVLTQVSKEELVEDDVIVLSRGNQIPADCVVIDGLCKANESLLTGESDLIQKGEGDELLSGSFISAGTCYALVTRVGSESYAARINSEAKYIKKNNSQILSSFNFIIKVCTFTIFPIGVMMFISHYFIQSQNLQATVVATVAALVGMIPGGMILLTSTVLAVSVVRLSRKNVLINEMYCIESLARVDVLCLDKTGTLTADKMNVHKIINLNTNDDKIKTALSSIVAASDEINATLQAISDYIQGVEAIQCKHFVPFSSETKWSGGTFENGKTYIMGAAEFVFSDKEKYAEIYHYIQQIKETVRILVLGSSDQPFSESGLPDDLHPMALILIKDQLRDNVNETVDYFKEQGVTLKVISGDSVKTVKSIAKDTGIEGAENAVDMTTVTTDEELDEVAERCNVFGRVTPAQKKKLVLALKAHGHSVAMTGDGVNDVLALKEADCSVAMASGSEAARNVSQIVLVDNDFASMPHVVAEGRRTINNVERSSSLYLVKTIYSIVLAVFFICFSMTYPFKPIQLTLVSAFTVGIPSFVLALQPNKNIIKGNFTFNIIMRAFPAAICVILNIITIAVFMAKDVIPMSDAELSTISVYITALSGMLLIVRLSIPFNALRIVMMTVCTAGFCLGSALFGQFFVLAPLSLNALLMLLVFSVVTVIIFNVVYNLNERMINKYKNRAKLQK